nr:DUF2818 family protein [Ramlibacter albus]
MIAAVIAANLPFLTGRLFGIVPLKRGKNFAMHVGELVALYFLVIGMGLLLEKRLGQIAPQGWEFYAITGALFITLAFPGFTWRYLRKNK